MTPSSTLPASAQRVQDALTALGFDNEVREMPDTTRSAADAAKACGCTVAQIAKSIVFRAEASDRAVLVITSGANRVDETKVAAHLGETLGKADADFVRARTGFAIGGVSVGEPLEEMHRVIAACAPLLPEDRPRYLMGVGTDLELLAGIASGVDLFDCVMPTRHARHGALFTRRGLLKIKNARYRDDPRPVDDRCSCPLCVRQSRAFVHHLVRTKEITGAVLATLHNLRYYLDFMADLREALTLGTLTALADQIAASYAGGAA